MNELLRLLGLCEGDGINTMSDEQLAETLAGLREEASALIDAEPNDEQMATLGRARDAVRSIEALQVQRAEQAATRTADLEDMRTAFATPAAGTEAAAVTDPAATAGQGTGEGAGAASTTGAEGAGGEAVAAGAGAGGDGGTPPAPPTSGTGGDNHDAAALVQVAERLVEALRAAAGYEAEGPGNVTRVEARRPARQAARVPVAPDLTHLPITASANVPGIPAGAPLDSPLKVTKAIMAAYNASKGHKGPRTLIKVARIGVDDLTEMYSPDRILDREDSQRNEEKIRAVRQSIAASGGPCAPLNVSYDIPELGTDARPMRDSAMVRFGADRGGAKTIPPASLADLEGSVSLWTMANDTNPTNPTHKPCLTMTCPQPTTDVVEAIVRCLQIGNFRNLYFAEQVQDWINKAAIVHARHAERELISKVAVGSSQVTFGADAGAALDVLTNLDRAVAAYENRHRLGDNHPPLRFVAPLWLTDLIRTDIVRQAHRGTIDEQYALADANIERWIQARNLNITWLLDGEAGQDFGPQSDGPGPSWPPFAVCYLYGEGEWNFLDGGTIDLGIVRDSVTNSTNDFQIFFESMEGAHFHGYESQRLAMFLCPDGSTGAAKTLSVCTTGS